MASKANEAALVFTLGLLIVLLVVVLIVLYKKFKKGKPDLEQEQAPKRSKKVAKALYKPQEVGVRTGRKRVFMTNKGLRVYEVNEKNWPMPQRTSSPSG